MVGRKKKLFIMIGIPGSGKSTWLQNHKSSFAISAKIISRDEIRFSLVKEDEEYFSKEKEVFNEYINQIKKSLIDNEETYADATHLNEASRGKLLRALGSSLKNIEVNAIVIKTSLKTAIKQNAERKGRTFVPVSVIKRTNSQMTIPSYEEGFDNIYIYKYIEVENKVHLFYYEKE